jgi:hypothetical protein
MVQERSTTMTEQEWLECTDPKPMLEFLRTQRTASERKLRFFAAACCRRVWDWLGEESRRAIEVLEKYLDGTATADDLHFASKGVYDDWMGDFGTHHPTNAACATVMFEKSTSHDVAVGAAAQIAQAVRIEANKRHGIFLQGWPPPKIVNPTVRQACIKAGEVAMTAERLAQCHLLREIFHGPRRAVFLRANWRSGDILTVASTIYNDRAFEQFPSLADALAAAGCDDEEILNHCRGPGPHVRGCWVVDLILSKDR